MADPDPRTALLDAATAMFERDGFDAVGVDAIRTAAGVASMQLYRIFGSKAGLIAAVLERWTGRWHQWLLDELARRPGEEPTGPLRLFDILEDWFTSDDFHGSLITTAAIELRGRPQHPAHQVIAAHRARLQQLLEELASQAGVADRDRPRIAEQLHLLVEGAIVRAMARRRGAAAADARALAASLLPRPQGSDS